VLYLLISDAVNINNSPEEENKVIRRFSSAFKDEYSNVDDTEKHFMSRLIELEEMKGGGSMVNS
jgi:hypothetical protein